MTETEALQKMISPGTRRPGKWRDGVIQIWLTRACNLACYSCTQGSNLAGNPGMMTPAQFEIACKSLQGYFGVVGCFGGNPAVSPHFVDCCEILRHYFPKEQCGLWSNNLMTEEKGRAARETFDPRISNLNCHLDREAYQNFKRWWPESMPFGLDRDSRHSPPYVAMRDVLKRECGLCEDTPGHGDDGLCAQCGGTGYIYDEALAWELISGCDINKHWSAMIGVFRGEVRAWFCEIAGAQAMLHQHEPDYPDTGVRVWPTPEEIKQTEDAVRKHNPPEVAERILKETANEGYSPAWWELTMSQFAPQVRKHCHECSVPLRGYGELAQGRTGTEQTSATHAAVYKPKVKGRPVEVVTELHQIKPGRIEKVTHYLQNARR